MDVPPPSTDDLFWAMEAKGDAGEANASKPERFAGVAAEVEAVDDSPRTGVPKDEEDTEGVIDGVEEPDDFLDPNTLGPFTEAKGDLAAA